MIGVNIWVGCEYGKVGVGLDTHGRLCEFALVHPSGCMSCRVGVTKLSGLSTLEKVRGCSSWQDTRRWHVWKTGLDIKHEFCRINSNYNGLDGKGVKDD